MSWGWATSTLSPFRCKSKRISARTLSSTQTKEHNVIKWINLKIIPQSRSFWHTKKERIFSPSQTRLPAAVVVVSIQHRCRQRESLSLRRERSLRWKGGGKKISKLCKLWVEDESWKFSPLLLFLLFFYTSIYLPFSSLFHFLLLPAPRREFN